jgi:twitching motility protein PilT
VTGMSGWLEALVNARGSDLHVKVGSSPRMRVDGRLVVLDGPVITSELAEALLSEVIRPDLYEEFQRRNEAGRPPQPGPGRLTQRSRPLRAGRGRTVPRRPPPRPAAGWR